MRDKQVLHADTADTQRLQIQDAGGAFVLSRKPGDSDEWTFESPADRKGKPVSSWKVLDPLGTMRAEEVLDHPAPSQLAQLSTPAIKLVLTGKDGKELSLGISKPSGDFVYAKVSGDTALYKLKKELFDQLNLSAADLSAGDSAVVPSELNGVTTPGLRAPLHSAMWRAVQDSAGHRRNVDVVDDRTSLSSS